MEPILSDKPAQIDIESAANSTWQYRSSANDEVKDDDEDEKDEEIQKRRVGVEMGIGMEF